MEKIAEGFKGEKAIITPYNIRNLQAQNRITQQLYITHIGYYPRAKFHFRERNNGTNENIFIYCEERSGWVQYKKNKYKIEKNQAFILPAHEAHAYGSSHTNPWSIYWFHFCGNNVNMFTDITEKPIDISESDKSRHNHRFALFEDMYRNLEKGYSPENLEYVSFCLMYFLASTKYLDQYREINSIREENIIQKAIIFMKDNLEEDISLKQIADHVGYSGSRFGTLFTEKTSYPPMVYYNQLKIQRACSYLQFSDLKFKEIAFRLGYYDAFHFSKVFKKEMEITPKEYRKRYKN